MLASELFSLDHDLILLCTGEEHDCGEVGEEDIEGIDGQWLSLRRADP